MAEIVVVVEFGTVDLSVYAACRHNLLRYDVRTRSSDAIPSQVEYL